MATALTSNHNADSDQGNEYRLVCSRVIILSTHMDMINIPWDPRYFGEILPPETVLLMTGLPVANMCNG